MKWKKKLTKKELTHIKETTERETLHEFKRNFNHQEATGIICFDCRYIAHKLGVKAEPKAQEHDHEKEGCRYLGFDLWDCGHIDNLEMIERPESHIMG